eukprot:scaffold34690_cov288-Amphora_coffeaeformis.AAC.2
MVISGRDSELLPGDDKDFSRCRQRHRKTSYQLVTRDAFQPNYLPNVNPSPRNYSEESVTTGMEPLKVTKVEV